MSLSLSMLSGSKAFATVLIIQPCGALHTHSSYAPACPLVYLSSSLHHSGNASVKDFLWKPVATCKWLLGHQPLAGQSSLVITRAI
jgi:hypothetical protein